jgi:23S rRNA (uracil1939-C5)-methyltransferase
LRSVGCLFERPTLVFHDLFSATVRAHTHQGRVLAPGECQSLDGRRCHLCFAVRTEYEREAELKNETLQEFWKDLRLPVPLEQLIPSPLGRGYRTVSKRKAFIHKGSISLALIDPDESGKPEPFPVVRCAIEPVRHAEIFQHLQQAVDAPHARPLAEQLRYVVIRGNDTELTVILNVREISGKLLSAANTLSKSLTRRFPSVIGLFLYLDETGGKYYLGVRNPRVRPTAKKLFGKSAVFQKACGKSFLFSPFSFSQVNQSLVERLVGECERLLALTREHRLYDLYCGYGLFALCLAERAREVIGVEVSHDSVDSAIENAERQRAGRVRFVRSNITADVVATVMKQLQPHDRVILDPPRGGTAEGVIETIAAFGPEKVVHLFCNIDLMPAEIKRWLSSGYEIRKAVPLDMFPGTSSVETVVLFEHRKSSQAGD